MSPPTEILRKEVFLLGAGFSRAVSAATAGVDHDVMPLLQDLGAEIRKRYDLPPFLNKLGGNFEHWLTFLAQYNPSLHPWHNQRNSATFFEISDIIRRIITEREQRLVQGVCPEWLLSFIKHLHYAKAQVITLNYDTIIERSALSTELQIDYSDMYVVPTVIGHARTATLWGSAPNPTFHLLKLHGSINWFHSERSSTDQIYHVRHVWRAQDHTNVDDINTLKDKSVLLVAPSIDKTSILRHDSLEYQWRLAADAIRQSNKIYCIGYSFPESDLFMQLFLKINSPDQRIEFEVVDLNPETERRIENLLKGNFTVYKKYSGQSAVADFASSLELPDE